MPSRAKNGIIEWFGAIQMPDSTLWIIMGDFHFIISPDERNKLGGNINDTFLLMKLSTSLV
jgi:hypothetical protein